MFVSTRETQIRVGTFPAPQRGLPFSMAGSTHTTKILVLLIFSFPNLYGHEWKCPMLSKLCFLDVSEHSVHFSRVAVGNLHPAHQRSKTPISPWPVLHFCFGPVQEAGTSAGSRAGVSGRRLGPALEAEEGLVRACVSRACLH